MCPVCVLVRCDLSRTQYYILYNTRARGLSTKVCKQGVRVDIILYIHVSIRTAHFFLNFIFTDVSLYLGDD